MEKKEHIHLSEVFGENWIANEAQREYFCNLVMRILTPNRSIDSIIEENLQTIRVRYDYGGISLGRSLRSIILDSTLKNLREKNYAKTKECIRILLAMYYNKDYINNHHWYDFRVEEFPYDNFEIYILSAVWMLLNIDEIPDIHSYDTKTILEICE